MGQLVQVRLAGVWREAVAAARTEHDVARQGWEAQLAETQDEARELETALEAAEARAETEQGQVQQLRAEVEEVRAQVQVQCSRADRAEALLEQLQQGGAK